jgi:hypothetical protein
MKSTHESIKCGQNSRGVALITTLILLSLFLVMTLAMVIATSSDTLINGYYRNFRGSFYAADSGITTVRQYMLSQLVAAIPPTFTLASGAPIPAGTETTVLNGVNNTSTGFGSYQSITGSQTASWVGTFKVDSTNTTLSAPTCLATYTGNTAPLPTCTTAGSAADTVTGYQYSYPYKITAIGQSRSNEQHAIEEDGSFIITVDVGGPVGANTSFAAWGMFIDQSPICTGSYLVPGTISGPVFTNGSWTFGTSGSYIFTDTVGSAGADFGYQFGSCYQSAAHNYNSGSQTIAPTFQGSVTLGQAPITPPRDSFNQERAVLDGMGTTDTQPSQAELGASLRNMLAGGVSGTPYPATGAQPSTGVFLPVSTTAAACGLKPTPCITGGGVFVQGNADSVVMSTATGPLSSGSHPEQVFTITQGGTTTTVTLDLVGQTTTISNGTTSSTVNGLPQNLNNNPPTEGTDFYVNGTIGNTSGSTVTGLSGPSSGPAIQDGSAVTVTAAGAIDITGNITYKTEPVTLNTSDSLIPGNNNGQVLGIFTAGGNVNLLVPTAGQNLEIDASIATLQQGGSWGIVNPGNAINTLNIVGGRIQNTIQNINTTTRNVYFDRRFASGGFAPPFFPASSITSNGVVNAVVTVSPPNRVSWTDKTAM